MAVPRNKIAEEPSTARKFFGELCSFTLSLACLRGETAFSMRTAKNCSNLDVLLGVAPEAFPGSSAGSRRNRWLGSSTVQCKTAAGFFLQQTPHAAEKWGVTKCLSVMFSGLTVASVHLHPVLLVSILVHFLFLQFFTPNSCCRSETQQSK